MNNTVGSVKIIYWNANGVRLKIPELKLLILKEDIDILLINETHLKNYNAYILNIPGYMMYHTERNDGAKGGTAIIIKQTIDHMQLNEIQTKNLEHTIIKAKIGQQEITLVSAYNSPNRQKPLLNSDLDKILRTSKPTIVAGDFNAKSPVWHSRTSNSNGKTLRKHNENRNDYSILAPEIPTIHPHNSSHAPDVLDIVLHKNLIFQMTVNVLNELDSDHLPVLLELLSNNKYKEKRKHKTIIDWEKYKKITGEIKLSNPTLTSKRDIDDAVDHLTSEIILAKRMASKEVPTTKSMDKKIQKLLQEKKKARKNFTRTRDPRFKTEYNNLIRIVRNKLRDIEEKEIIKELDDDDPQNDKLWKHTRIAKIPEPILRS